MMVSVGVDRVLTVDLHAEQIQGFFTCPVDNVYASPILNDDIVASKYKDVVVVSPDIGGVVRARAIAKQLDDADLAIIDKRRPRANESEVMNLIGDVEGRTAIMVDDMVDTAGTLCAPQPTRSKSVARKKWSPTVRTPYCQARRSTMYVTLSSMSWLLLTPFH